MHQVITFFKIIFLIILQFFKFLATFIQGNSQIFRASLATIAMILGALNIKDFLFYKKGSFATEMPLFMRPRVKRITEKVSTPAGAFVLGFLLTTFLLPCTVGPYLIASGLLSNLGILGALPWLLYYNLLFVLPMIIIVFFIYSGFKKVEEVSGWREMNIKILHLIAGILLFVVGLSLLMGWI